MNVRWSRPFLPLGFRPNWASQRHRLADVSWMSLVDLALSRDVAEALDFIVEHCERKQRLEIAAEEARSLPRKRRQLLDSAGVIATFAEEMDEILKDYDYGSPLRCKSRCPGQMVEGQITWANLVGYRSRGLDTERSALQGWRAGNRSGLHSHRGPGSWPTMRASAGCT